MTGVPACKPIAFKARAVTYPVTALCVTKLPNPK